MHFLGRDFLIPVYFAALMVVAGGEIIVERTNALALLLASIQCFPSGESENGETQRIIDLNRSFNPEDHLDKYEYPNRVKLLLEFIKNETSSNPPDARNDDPFTNSPEDIEDFSIILNVLYPNAENWELFYNTSVWLVDKVSSAELFWALMVVSAEKFSDTVVVPTAVEIFPQLFIDKHDVLSVAGLPVQKHLQDDVFPITYWLSDPGLNEFHTHWHIENPFWWNEELHGVVRHRRGELFLFMHHQMVCRFEAELQSHGLAGFPPLELDANYEIPEGYRPDIVNINYKAFPERKKGTKVGDFGNSTSLGKLQTWFGRLGQGIDDGYFRGPNNSVVSLRETNSSDILGNTMESSPIHSANFEYYGSFHNYLHRELAGMSGEHGDIPGVEGHSETAMRDPVFFRLHKRIDSLYHKLKSYAPPYSNTDLDFPGVAVKHVTIESPKPSDDKETIWPFDLNWPSFKPKVPTLWTYFSTNTYDISTAARPCRNVSHGGTPAHVTSLNHVDFKYMITLQSSRSQVAFGIVRIFMWPENTLDGKKLEGNDAHSRAIEMDRFRVKIEPNQDTIIARSSLNCSFTKVDQAPGIKALFSANDKSSHFKPGTTRACGFPNNLLVPKGTKEGIKYKLTVFVSDETEHGWNDDYPNYPLCGALNGIKYPDSRPMGFPFDRPGTKFVANEGLWPVIAPTVLKNIKEIKILIKHVQNKREYDNR